MNESMKWPLLAKYLSGECTGQEKQVIENWINADTENQHLVDILKISWNTDEPEIQSTDTSKLWQQLSENVNMNSGLYRKTIRPEKNHISDKKRWSFTSNLSQNLGWRYAAVLLIFLLSAFYLYTSNIMSFLEIKTKTEFKTVLMKNGQRDFITLSDGSKITLDAGSNLNFPTKFAGDRREVYLNGEAFFEVASNPEKPFIVFVNQAAVEVLGTKFNIRAWQQEQKITVTVAEGKVLLHPETNDITKSIALSQGYASTLPANGQPTIPQMVDVQRSLGWMQNEILFEDTPLSQILSQLERWYDVEFVTQDSTIMNDRLTVHLENRPFEDHLKLLGELVNVHFVRTGKIYRLIPG